MADRNSQEQSREEETGKNGKTYRTRMDKKTRNLS